MQSITTNEGRIQERSENRRTALQAAAIVLQDSAIGDADQLLRMADRLFAWLER